jgi:hypothetical protein
MPDACIEPILLITQTPKKEKKKKRKKSKKKSEEIKCNLASPLGSYC